MPYFSPKLTLNGWRALTLRTSLGEVNMGGLAKNEAEQVRAVLDGLVQQGAERGPADAAATDWRFNPAPGWPEPPIGWLP